MAKIALPIGNIKVPENQKDDFIAVAREHFGPKRNPDSPDEILGEYTEAELVELMTAELRNLWTARFKAWKRAQQNVPSIDLT